MSKTVLEPTDYNLMETFINDQIGRNEEVVYFIKMLLELSCGSSIALNGAWGCGKTFFTKQVKMVLDAYNPNNDYGELDDKNLESIRNHFISIQDQYNVKYEIERYPTVYYDAWKNDDSQDPFISLLYAIATRFNSSVPTDRVKEIKSLITKGLSCIADVASLYTPINVKTIYDKFINFLDERDDVFSIVKREESINKRIEEFFNETFDDEEKKKIIIFVDELDRCNPEFAVRFLEKVKHYFNNNGVVFVFSCNINELQHSIRAYYGNEFNASKYLDRFFNYQIELGYPNIKKYLSDLGASKDVLSLNIKEVANHFHFQLREACKFYDSMQKAIGSFNPQKSQDSENINEEEESVAFLITWVLPYIIGLRFHDINLYYEFLNGQGVKDYTAFIKKTQFYSNNFITKLLNSDERIDDQRVRVVNQIKYLSRDQKLENFYSSLFPQSSVSKPAKHGVVIVNKEVVNKFMNIIHGVSSIAKYNDD